MNRFKIAKMVSSVATVFSVIGGIILLATNNGQGGILANVGAVLLTIGVLGAIVSYVFAGFVSAIKMAWSIARWGWFVVPIFPLDLLIFFFALELSIIAFFIVPIIPVMMSSKKYQPAV